MSTSFSQGMGRELMLYSTFKTLQVDGNGAQIDNIFNVTGTIQVRKLYGIITRIADITTCTASSWDFSDGVNTAAISSAAGTTLSAAGTNSAIIRRGLAATALVLNNATQPRIADANSAGNEAFSEFELTSSSLLLSYIRFRFTGDLLTNFDIKFCAEWRPISDDGMLTAV